MHALCGIRSAELRRRGLSVDGLLSGGDGAALAELERLLLYHIITAQPCGVFMPYLEASGAMPANSGCWGGFEHVTYEGTGL